MKIKTFLLILIALLVMIVILQLLPSTGDDVENIFHLPSPTLAKAMQTGKTATAPANPLESTIEMVSPETTPEPLSTEQPSFDEPTVNHLEVDLYQASLKFIADDPEDADEIAKSINYINGLYENASNVCGPLSIAILQEAGLMSATFDPQHAWLLCLRDQEGCDGLRELSVNYFPFQTYEYIFYDENVRTYDFVSNPLEVGDFLYLLAGDTGYDHMLVVTRIDEEGAAYSVTNADRGEGFKILEEMLYHPQKFEEGFFYEFTERSRGMLAMTGNGGMVIIRRKGGIDALPIFTKPLENTLIPGVDWRILVKELSTDKILFESYPNRFFHPASMIKIPMAMVALDILEEQGIFPSDFQDKGFGGFTFEQLFNAVVVSSDEDVTEILFDFIKSNGGERKRLQAWDISNSTFFPRRTTAFDIADLLEGLYQNRWLHPDMGEYLLNLMRIETENDSHYLGVIRSVSDNNVLHNKRGTLLSPTIVSDMGIYEINDQAYVIIISGTPKQTGAATFESIQSSLEYFSLSLGNLISEFGGED